MAAALATKLGHGSAVLVHGLWSNPDDWTWVCRRLAEAGIHVAVPDLPSHRSATVGLAEDADDVRRAIRSCPAPVVVAGWSYGGTVIGVAAAGEASVVRLLYVSSLPAPVADDDEEEPAPPDDPHIIVGEDGTCVLDNEWWLTEEKGRTFSPEVLEHLWRHPRRPVSLRAWTGVVTAAAWQSIPTTVLIGRDDELLPADGLEWARVHVSDIRYLDTDHFIPFREPDAVSQIVLEALGDR